MAKHNEIALETARQGIVLLKNDGVLPLATDTPLKIAVIGGHAQVGVPSGTGSSAVLPRGRLRGRSSRSAVRGSWDRPRNLFLLPSSPLAELQEARAQGARSSSTPGRARRRRPCWRSARTS